jgi:hypothetical protein
MIRKSAILLLCGFLTFNINAQNFGGGLILGLSTSQVGGDNLAGFHKAGLLIGIFANKIISKPLSFQMEMTYIQKGSKNPKINDTEHPNYLKQDISSSYIEVPLVLQYNKNNKLKIEGGIQTAYLIDGYYNDIYGKIEYYSNPPFIDYDIGLLLGFEYNYSENISLNTRISSSILKIGTEDYVAQGISNLSKKGKYNSVLNFALHYNF